MGYDYEVYIGTMLEIQPKEITVNHVRMLVLGWLEIGGVQEGVY